METENKNFNPKGEVVNAGRDEKPRILQYFAYEHLPPVLRAKSRPLHDLAHAMTKDFHTMEGHQKAETVAGLRKLLEAKDCFVRASLP